tara:strand:- start:598 stop:1332 length:735 start_codon:yes stop_codon:yes gene_type:complete
MFKKILILFIIVLFQNSYSYSREFNYEVYSLNLNFLNIKFNTSKNKLYSIINSKGLAGYFIKSQSIILTTLNTQNNTLNYYFNSQSKNKNKTYNYKKINNVINIDNIKLNKGKNFKKIIKTDLQNTFDPLSAVELILYNNILDSKCKNSKKIYDGDDVYSISLAQNKKNHSFIKFKDKKYKISFSCRLNYKAISGHKFKREEKLNSRYLDIYFSQINNNIVPVYFEANAKLVPLKMYLSTILTP